MPIYVFQKTMNRKVGKDEWLAKVITELEKEIDFGISILTNIIAIASMLFTSYLHIARTVSR